MGRYKQRIHEDGKLAVILAIVSFIIGTLLFLSYVYTLSDNLIYTGIIYVAIALFFNIIMLLRLLFNWIVLKELRGYLFLRIVILCLNIPICLYYIKLIVYKYNP